MKLTVIDSTKAKKGDATLPSQFNEQVRQDLISRAALTIAANKRQKYGAKEGAGMRASADVSKRRRKYRGSYGIGISRTPRKVTSRSGTRMNWTGAEAPQTVGGRRAHPPKAEKEWSQKLNVKERKKALRSALAATLVKDIVQTKGHQIPTEYPFVLDNSVEQLKKTKDVKGMLETLGFTSELDRARVKKVRAGKGTMRGRKYTKRKGPLFVVSKQSAMVDAAKNIPGVDIVPVQKLSVLDLAPGAVMGRATLFTAAALETMEKKKLFM